MRNPNDHGPRKLAERAGLRYVGDDGPGVQRRPLGGGFRYVYTSGRPVRDKRRVERFKSLAVPPAWTDVWISCDPRSYLQATGRDDKGRKQFLYHPDWQEAASRAKFDALIHLGNALPRIRRQVAMQLRKQNSSREKTLALIVRLLDLTGMRVGHEEYVQENGAYGLTTLRRRHLHLNGTSAEFRFKGKSGQKQVVKVVERSTLRALRSCGSSEGKCLFAYRDGDSLRTVDADEVNQFVRRVSKADITAKDFRTWLASAIAAEALYEKSTVANRRARKKHVVEVTAAVARILGNTPSVCRKSYLDPRLLNAYEEGQFPRIFADFKPRKVKWLRRGDQIFRHALAKL